jgi:hypothetical protein
MDGPKFILLEFLLVYFIKLNIFYLNSLFFFINLFFEHNTFIFINFYNIFYYK